MDICQCCGMPMTEENDLYGTNSDESVNKEYCKYCYEKGEFIHKCSLEEMIELCASHMLIYYPDMKKEEATESMRKIIPKLKYWNKDKEQ